MSDPMNQSGALRVLGSASPRFPQNMSMDSNILDETSNIPFHLSRNADVMIIDGFIIPESINLNDIKTFDITYGGHLIYSIPFDIIIATTNAMHNIKIKNNKYFIKFPHELFTINSSNQYLTKYLLFPLISLQYHEITINLKSIINFDYKLITKNIYYQPEIRGPLAQNSHHIDIYGYQSFDINKASVNIDTSFISTGLYVLTNSKLTDFKLYLNNMLTQEFAEDLIEFHSCLIYEKALWTKEHENVLYSSLYLPEEIINIIEGYIEKNTKYMYFIPFNTLDNKIDGTINFGRCSDVKVDIKTKDNIYNGKIYNKHVNRLKINSGMGSLEFSN
jgi:hypothetical protein